MVISVEDAKWLGFIEMFGKPPKEMRAWVQEKNIIECMYKEPLVNLFHVCLMMFWTLNMVLFLAFDMELHFLANQLGLFRPFVFHFAI
jgi:hypothetical protein